MWSNLSLASDMCLLKTCLRLPINLVGRPWRHLVVELKLLTPTVTYNNENGNLILVNLRADPRLTVVQGLYGVST